MKIKQIILLLLLFIVANTINYFVTKTNEQQRIDIVLEDNLKRLQTHYEILLHSQMVTAKTIYMSTLQLNGFVEIIKAANSADAQQKKLLRKQLYKLLQAKYEIIKLKDVLQYQFVLPNNESFLRMHKPSKFGDDLTDIRADFKYVNQFKKPVRGFVQGRVAHGFRNTFPIFDEKGNHIGAMEVSFSSDSFQKYLNDISHIHTHFLVNKNIFDAKTWARDDLVLKYFSSAEHDDYMVTLDTSKHTVDKCITENAKSIAAVQDEVVKGIENEKPFSTYLKYKDKINVLSFIPIQNLNNTTSAWLVSYERSEFIALTLETGLYIRIALFFVLILFVYLIYKEMNSKEIIKKEHNLLNEVLSTTEDIIFITNFKEIVFSNKKFKELLNIKHSNEYSKNILDMFIVSDGYLHRELLEDDESFIGLIQRTPENERIVSIMDKHFSTKVFKIDIVQIDYQHYDDYLVTLTDITILKEEYAKTEKKAYYDGLTSVYNRYKFDEIISVEIENAQRYHRYFSLAILDIDKFKNFNDTYGHLVGDEVLIMLATHVQESIRQTDVFARWGGEEFIILFKETDVLQAKIVLEKIRESISELEHETAGKVTASFGVTEFKSNDTQDTIFKRCDDALYKAKEGGRNRVEVL